MKVFDLHTDLSSFCLATGRDNLSYHGKLGSGFLPDQVDLPRLKQGNVKILLASICPILTVPQGFNLPEDGLSEVFRQLNFYLEQKDAFKKFGISFLLSIEGIYFIKERKDLSLVKLLKKAGVISIAPIWNLSNALGTGADDINSKKGLTKLGRLFIEACEESGIVVDAVHASRQTLKDIIKYSKKPVIVSHTASFAITPHNRNLTKEQIRLVVGKGGLIGLCFIQDFLGGSSIKGAASHLRSLVDLAGIEHVAIGSDFAGMTREDLVKGLEHVGLLPRFFDFCLKNGFNQKELEKIFWGNAKNFFNNFRSSNKIC